MRLIKVNFKKDADLSIRQQKQANINLFNELLLIIVYILFAHEQKKIFEQII